MSEETPKYNDENEENANSGNKNQESAKYNPFIEFNQELEHFKKIGFWNSLNNATNPRGAYEQYLEKHSNLFEEKKRILNDFHFYDIERFKEQIRKADEKIISINEKLNQQNDILPLEDEAEKIREKIEVLRNELRISLKRLGDEKESLIDKRIEKAFQELDLLIDKYRDIAGKHFALNRDAQERNGDAFQIKPNLLQQLQNHYEKIFREAQEKFESLGFGNWLDNSWSLKTFGLLAALASGYFFSIFSIETKLGNESVPFFIFTGLFNLVGNLISSQPWGIFIVFLLIAGLPFLFLLVAYICQRLLNKYEEGREKKLEDFKLTLNQNNEIEIAEAAETTDFYCFLLKRTPLLFVLSIIFALVAFGYYGATSVSAANPVNTAANNKLTALDISLTSSTIGIFLALALSGVVYIYILNIFEPRLEKVNSRENKTPPPRSWRFWANFELIGILIVVLLLLFALLFGSEKYFFFNIGKAMVNKKSFIAFLLFIVSVLLTAISFGYGVYFSAINEVKDNVERKLRVLNQTHANNSFPGIKSALFADKAFGIKYVNIVNKLIELVSAKTDLAGEFIPKNQKQANQKQSFTQETRFFSNPFKWIRENIFRKNSYDLPIELTAEDKHYFPEITSEIENIHSQIRENRQHIEEIESEIKGRQQENTEYIRKLKEEKSRLESQNREWKKHISFLNREHFKEVERFIQKHQQEVSELKDGFNLALWFIAYGGKPPGSGSDNFDGVNTDG